MSTVCIVGAGFSGATIAHELACAGHKCVVCEKRQHVAGNCYTERDETTGVMVHVYGPHIFHTDDEHVWNYVQQFGKFEPFVNRVKAITTHGVFTLPINLLTINQFFGKTFSPEQAQQFLNSIGDKSIEKPRNFEEQALHFVGKDLYEAFFKGYTIKQWGVNPVELPASILKRLPIRFSYDDNYYNSKFQGIPQNGYTGIVENLLDHRNITVCLGVTVSRKDAKNYDHTFYTGPLDGWFDFSEGHLGYRTLDFSVERHSGDWQGNAVINYCDSAVPWTRICEHKHFAPQEMHAQTVIFKEHSRNCKVGDVPFYPIRLVSDKQILERYMQMIKQEQNVTFVGRLATYRYLDMDAAIGEALAVAKEYSAQ